MVLSVIWDSIYSLLFMVYDCCRISVSKSISIYFLMATDHFAGST